MTSKILSAGDIIESRCTKCREVLNHRIVAMVEGKVVRVECNTCNGVHNYYPPPAAKTAKAPKKETVSKPRSTAATPRTSRKDPVEIEREEWASLSPTFDLEKVLPYNMNSRFAAKRLIEHPVFGIGVVKTVTIPNKMQVLFKEGIKLLRCQYM